MRRFKYLGKDHLSAALLLVIGIGVLGFGSTYQIGTLSAMGAGFFPVAVGVLMILIAIAIGVTAAPNERIVAPRNRRIAPSDGPQWRGWLCIIGSVVAFVVLGNYGGMVPATFAAVALSAMGDREATLKTSTVLATIVTVFGVAVFHYGLSLQLPLFQWGG